METGKLFFSYGRADAEFVLKLAVDLRSIGTNLWLDQLDIPGGARWDHAVEEALKASPCLLVVLSPASVTSHNVMDEVSFGLETHKTIVPILYRDCDIPFRLRRLQYIDFRVGYDDGFKRLIQTLKLADQLPTRPSVKSIPETRGPSEKEETKQVSGLNAHELTAIPEASQLDRSETNQTSAAKLTLTPFIGGVDENHWIRLLHRRMPLLLWLSLLPYVGFVWLLLGSNEKDDRAAGFLFVLNVVIVVLGSIGSYFGKIPASKVCGLGALVQVCILIAMLSLGVGDTGIVIAINLAVAVAFGGMMIFYDRQERKHLLPNPTIEQESAKSARRSSS
jgi:hypothetical protein